METDKREGLAPVPSHIESWLNSDQKAMLVTIESYGWEIKCIRRMNDELPKVIVVNPNGHEIGVLEDSGELNLNAEVTLR